MRRSVLLIAAATLPGLGCFHGSGGQPMSLLGKSDVMASEGNSKPTGQTQELPDKAKAAVFITMAEGLEQKGNDGDAIVYFEQARTLDPSLGDRASRHLAVLYDRVDEQAKAMHEFQDLLRKKPKDAALLNDVGYSYYNRGQWAEAENHLRKAVTFDKGLKSAWVNLGLALAQQGKLEESLEAFSHAVSTAEAYSNLGFVLAVQGKKPEAAAAYRRALELEPALKIAQTAV
jgi:tetratricopeptide (TPR) repeat protein